MKELKSSLKYMLALSLMLGLSSLMYGQRSEPSDRLLDAEEELYELIQIDKNSLSKRELRTWKKQKRHLQRIINEEKEKDEFYSFRRNRYNRNFYNPYYGGYGWYAPRFYRYPRRVIVVRR